MTAPSLKAYAQGQSEVSADNLNTFVQSCSTLAQLRAFIGLPGIAVTVTGISPAAIYIWNAAATAADNGGSVIAPTGAGTGRWLRVGFLAGNSLPGVFDVTAYGAVGNGTTDDTIAIQAAIDAALSAGGTVYFPPGNYKISATLVVNLSSVPSDASLTRIWITGNGNGSTAITSTQADAALRIVGGTSGAFHTYLKLEGLRFSGPGVTSVGSHGVELDNTAFLHMTDCTITGYEYGLWGTDVVSTRFENVEIRFNSYGFYFAYGDLSRPNAISFVGCTIANNENYGGYAVGAACLGLVNCTVEGNGAVGVDANRWGLKVEQCGVEGAIGLSVFNTYFENNANIADIWIVQSSYRCAFFISGSSFVRGTSSYFVDSNIRLDLTTTVNKQTVTILGCGFDSRGTYTEDPTRPYIDLTNLSGANANIELFGNLYGDSSIRPANGVLAQPNGLAQVYARFNGSPAGPALTITRGMNLSTVTKNGTGDYTLTYFRALQVSSNIYSIQLGSAIGFHTIFSESTTTVRIKCFDSAGVAADFDNISLTVYGVQPE